MKQLLYFICIVFFVSSLNANNPVLENKKLLQIKSSNLVNKGMYKEAIILLEQGIERYPNNDYLISQLGRCYQGQNNIDKAEIYYQKALKINPNNELALLYIEKTKKTKKLLKNDTQEEVYNFLKDKGVDLLFIFLGFLAGEILATILMRCDRNNWKLIVYKIQLKQEQNLYLLNPKYLIKIVYKYIFDSVCPLKIILSYITLLMTSILIFISYEIINNSVNITTSHQLWQYIFNISIYATIIIFLGWIIKIGLDYKNTQNVRIKLIETLHKMYQNQNIIEMHELLQELSKINDKNNFKMIIDTYIIDKEESKYFILKLHEKNN
jgi:tetratricopeptide (TPR) repeat protein